MQDSQASRLCSAELLAQNLARNEFIRQKENLASDEQDNQAFASSIQKLKSQLKEVSRNCARIQVEIGQRLKDLGLSDEELNQTLKQLDGIGQKKENCLLIFKEAFERQRALNNEGLAINRHIQDDGDIGD
jgi:3-methyladenine DNA glycosylase/8-oxoguanine DNA glycosylase